MATNFEKLRRLLEELFQLDQADLDFGIYRIMNQKRDEIVDFLDKKLLPQVQEAFSQYKSADKAEIQKELDTAIEQAKGLGVDPESTTKVKELREKYDGSAVDVAALENEVFSHLCNFFRRYYHEGDFISQRRYKEGVYAIPYEGEEIKLHWANHDQYYIKSSEYFRDYIFTLVSGKKVRVHLVAASSEQDNKQEQVGKERRFVICQGAPIYEENGELYIRFEYKSDNGKKRQDALNQEAIEQVLQTGGIDSWVRELGRPAPTKANPKRTVLEKHLTQYTARNSFDYFIHKDLGGFLRRELDFYIKNEVMHIDDIEYDTVPRVEQYLSKLKVIRKIAKKLIMFLEQLENFQKRIWLKKKFVIETNYCVTLDRIPVDLYPDIVANDAQAHEWRRLFGLSEPLTVELLQGNQRLLIDTKFFSKTFVERLQASFGDLSKNCDGLLLHCDNFQGLNLIGTQLRSSVKCIYIDPPYNTGSSAILYKNSYRHSSWATMMRDRLSLLKQVLREDGALFVSIDKTERTRLQFVLDEVFGQDNQIEELIWTQNTANSQLPNYSTNHEYVEVYTRNRAAVERDLKMFREPKPGYSDVMELVAKMNPTYPHPDEIQNAIKQLYKTHIAELRSNVEASGKVWNDAEKKKDPWKGIFNYNRAEYRDCDGHVVPPEKAKDRDAVIWVWREISPSAPASKQSSTTKDPDHLNYRYYKPLHPTSGKPCQHPKGGWKFPQHPDPGKPARRSFESLAADDRIAWGDDETKVPQTKGFLHQVETNIGTSVFYEYNDGEAEVSSMFGESGVFLSPKSSRFVKRFVSQTTSKDDVVLDCFGGSGSSGHAVVSLNREDQGQRKYVLMEMGHHFDAVTKPRMLKAVYSSSWKDGHPDSESRMGHVIKYLRLESYEDALNNLELKRSDQQGTLLKDDQELNEQYTLSYMLDVESRGSQSLLNVDGFRNPDEYKLKVEKDGETQLVNVDLMETFNWLLGLTVKHIDVIRGVRVVEGTNPEGDRVLILWRNLDETDNDALDKWFAKQDYNTKEQVYDIFYVNGDSNIENLRRPDQTWKVRLIEEEFQRLMFDVEDV